MQPSTNMSKKSGVVSSSICSIAAAMRSARRRVWRDSSIIAAPSSAALPTLAMRSGATLAMKPIASALPMST